MADARTPSDAARQPARAPPGSALLRIGSTVLRRLPVWPLAIWVLLVAGALLARPPLAGMELTGLSIAWDMWLGGSLLPRLNGQLLADQPPLLYWLIVLAWRAFGVGEDVARLVAPAFALASLLTIGPIARQLWPERRRAQPLAPVLLAGTGAFAVFCGASLPIVMQLFFACLGMLGLALAWRGRAGAGWSLFALGFGLGFLTTGVPAVLGLLPVALAGPLWQRTRPARGWTGWYVGLAVALAAAGSLDLLWLWPAAATGGPDAIARIAAGASASMSVAAPWYWPALALPMLLYPWILWRTLWRALRRQRRRFHDPALRLCLAAAAAAAIAWLATGREASAFLPAVPPLVLIATRLVAAHGGKPRDFHAVIPGLLALLAGVAVSLLNIIPVAHLDAIWRELVSENSLPIWFGGSSLLPGLLLLGGGFLLAQMTPRDLVSRVVQLALLPPLFVTAVNIEFRASLRPFFDLAPIASTLHDLQAQDRPIGFRGHYRGEFNFPGRLRQPIAVLGDTGSAIAWAADHPDGIMISYFEGSLLRMPGQPIHLGPAGDRWAALWPAETVVRTGGAVLSPRF